MLDRTATATLGELYEWQETTRLLKDRLKTLERERLTREINDQQMGYYSVEKFEAVEAESRAKDAKIEALMREVTALKAGGPRAPAAESNKVAALTEELEAARQRIAELEAVASAIASTAARAASPPRASSPARPMASTVPSSAFTPTSAIAPTAPGDSSGFLDQSVRLKSGDALGRRMLADGSVEGGGEVAAEVCYVDFVRGNPVEGSTPRRRGSGSSAGGGRRAATPNEGWWNSAAVQAGPRPKSANRKGGPGGMAQLPGAVFLGLGVGWVQARTFNPAPC